MNNQYLQWLSGPRRGEVETAEMMQDGQTFEDVVIFSGGKIPMSKIGKDFIILPDANSALNPVDLDLMYPKPNPKQNRRVDPKQRRAVEEPPANVDHASILGFDPSQSDEPAPKQPERQHQRKNSSFASDLLTRAKKNDTKITLDLALEMPSSAFFSMINETFEETTVNEVIDIIIDSIDQDAIRSSIKESIIKFYGGVK